MKNSPRCVHTLLRCALTLCLTVTTFGLTGWQSVAADWNGGLEGGTVVRDSGSATRLRLVLRNDTRPFSQYVYAQWLNGGSGNNSYSIGYNPRYWLGDTYYVFGESSIGIDEPLSIERDIQGVVGMGGQFLATEEQGLYAEVGVGGRSLEFEFVDETSTQALGLVRAGYYQQLLDMFKFDIDVSGSISEEDVTEGNLNAGIAVRVAGGAIRVGYRSRYLKVGDLADSQTDDDTEISFTYGF